ncbi:MAG: glycoside hydrolase family 3 C-terminal domain-containing protein [Candidatus Izemoplasma sp.]|nr:glycoside hydrolase family 3 C-terminal domain-containing protein [Candidatus Izemoplasma sp.]
MKKNNEIIKEMSLEEKASMLSGKNFWESRDIEKYNIKSMFLADGPHGIRKQVASADHLGLNPSQKATCFPTAATLANSFDTRLLKQIGEALGKEAIDQRVNILLGPGTNIKRNPKCGRNFEYFSEDPYLSGKLTSSMIQGIQSQGISACIKHYAANNQEYRRMVIDALIDERTLNEIYLPAFEMAVKEGHTKTLMSAYNKVNNHYVNESPYLLKDILRTKWKFDGVIVSDWGGSNSRIEGLKNGNDLEMPSTHFETNRELVEAVNTQLIDEELLDQSIERLLRLSKETNDTLINNSVNTNYDDHHELAIKAAEASIVLLKNEDNILPLKEGKRVTIIGDFAESPRIQGAGSSKVNPYKVEHTLDNISHYPCHFIGFEKGFKRFSDKSSRRLIKKAKTRAKNADVVLYYMGLDESKETEGIDRSNILIRKNQIELLKELSEVNPNIIVILSSGSVVDLELEKYTKGLIHAYLGGQGSAKAVLNIIFGYTNPSGKLAETYPINLEELEKVQDFGNQDTYVCYKDNIYVGYRFYDQIGLQVRYPFGYGLSYTTFKYSNINISEKKVSFTITNTGNYDGAEVSQLYISKEDSALHREKQSLKGFKKTFIKKGENKRITIPFDDYTFRVYDQNNHQFVIENGEYRIVIKSSSRDTRLSGKITLEGTQLESYNNSLTNLYKEGKIHKISNHKYLEIYNLQSPEEHSLTPLIVNELTTVSKLKHAKGFSGKIFYFSITFMIWFLRRIHKAEKANTLVMGIYHQPLKSLSRMSGGIISWSQLSGLIKMFNGSFIKGLVHYIKAGKEKRYQTKREIKRIQETKK